MRWSSKFLIIRKVGSKARAAGAVMQEMKLKVAGRALMFGMVLGSAHPATAQTGNVQTKQYDDGGIYEGTFRNGLQHGTGTYTLPNGYEYAGEWIDGEIRGTGVARFPNGSVYEGEFTKGKPEGIGKIVFSDGGTYEGALSLIHI